MKTIHALSLILTLVLGLTSCEQKSKAIQGFAPDRIPVKVLPLMKSTNIQPIAVSGQFTTDDEVVLAFKTGGVIDKILVKEGDAVRQGQVLATLILTEINAQVKQAQLGVDKALRDYDRVQSLYRDSVATLEQVQNVKTGLDLAHQQLSAAQFNQGHSVIRAPKSGFVLKKLANVGQVVNAGSPVLQTNGANSSNWVLRVGLNDANWATIRANDTATISIGSAQRGQFKGVVSRKSEGVDPATGTLTADIKLVGKMPLAIATGMFGKAIIAPCNSINTSRTGWRVPYDAVLDGDGRTGFAFVTSDNKVAHKVKVLIAGIEKDEVIISEGLENANGLIVSGSAYLADNGPIKVIQ